MHNRIIESRNKREGRYAGYYNAIRLTDGDGHCRYVDARHQRAHCYNLRRPYGNLGKP